MKKVFYTFQQISTNMVRYKLRCYYNPSLNAVNGKKACAMHVSAMSWLTRPFPHHMLAYRVNMIRVEDCIIKNREHDMSKALPGAIKPPFFFLLRPCCAVAP